MTFGRLQVDVGMDVTDNNATRVGHVAEVHQDGFIVTLDDGGTCAFPYDAIQAIVGNRIALQPHPETMTVTDEGNTWLRERAR